MAGVSNKQPASNYCVDMVKSAIYYTKDISAWTPNNIKTLILSPDGVVVQLHSTNNLIKKTFIPNQYMTCISDPKYKKMVTALGGGDNLVCSHTEEIIYCLSGVSGGYLHSEEANLTSIIASGKASRTDTELIKSIGERYKRMYAVTFFNGTVNDLMQISNAVFADKNKLTHFADLVEKANGGNVVYIHKEDWYKGYYFRPSTYKADAETGIIYKTLHKIEQHIESERRKNIKDKHRQESLKGLNEKAEPEISRLRVIIKLGMQLYSLLLKENIQGYLCRRYIANMVKTDMATFANGNKAVEFKDILKLSENTENNFLERIVTLIHEEDIPSTEDRKTVGLDEIMLIHKLSIEKYKVLSSNLVKYIKIVYESNPLLVKTLFTVSDTGITMFNEHNGASIEEIAKATGDHSLMTKKADIEKSMINLCTIASRLFINDKIKHKQEYWKAVYEKAVK